MEDIRTKALVARTMSEDDVQEGVKLFIAPYAFWEEFLMTGQATIAILGELAFTSSNTDFFVNMRSQKRRRSESFRDSLLDVVNRGWNTFHEGQDSMDKIRLQSLVACDHMNTAIRILKQDNDHGVEMSVFEELRCMKTTIEKCQDLSASMAVKFTSFMNKIQELTDSVNAESEDRSEEEKAVAEQKLKKEKTEKETLRMEAVFKEWEKQEDDRRRKALESEPSDEKLLIMNIVEHFAIALCAIFTDPIRNMFNGVAKSVSRNLLSLSGMASGSTTSNTVVSDTQQRSSCPKFASETSVSKYRIRVDDAGKQLNQVREMRLKFYKELKDESTESPVSLENCEVVKIDFTAITKSLSKCMEAVEKVKAQWKRMVCILQMIAKIIETCLDTYMQAFVKAAEKADSRTAQNSVKDVLYMQAFLASNLTILVNMISTTYTRVSKPNLSKSISSLHNLMDPEKSQMEYDEFRKSCEQASNDIKSLVRKSKSEFHVNVKARFVKLEQDLRAVLPISSDEIKEMNRAIHRWMKDLTAEEETEFAHKMCSVQLLARHDMH